MKVGVMLDTWKVKIFLEHLEREGFTADEGPGITDDTTLLTVHAPSWQELEPVLRAATKVCHYIRKQSSKRTH